MKRLIDSWLRKLPLYDGVPISPTMGLVLVVGCMLGVGVLIQHEITVWEQIDHHHSAKIDIASPDAYAVAIQYWMGGRSLEDVKAGRVRPFEDFQL
jgi:hypothetical protein